MSTPIIRKIVGDSYRYKYLTNIFSEEELKKYSTSLQRQYSKLTKNWSDDLHSEWTARMFLAAKMIYSSTLLLNTAQYSKHKNIQITEPYLLYYSIFNCCRALIFSHPSQIWRDGKLIVESHSKVISNSTNVVNTLSKKIASELKHLVIGAKDYRELFSYKYPARGLTRKKYFEEIEIDNISLKCSVLCELAQYTSECFQSSYEKNCLKKSYNLKEEVLEKCCSYIGDSYFLIDDEDSYRISYILRKVKRPYNIYFTMTEGMTDDFFGSWCSTDDPDEDSFNPDKRLIEIFDLP